LASSHDLPVYRPSAKGIVFIKRLGPQKAFAIITVSFLPAVDSWEIPYESWPRRDEGWTPGPIQHNSMTSNYAISRLERKPATLSLPQGLSLSSRNHFLERLGFGPYDRGYCGHDAFKLEDEIETGLMLFSGQWDDRDRVLVP
jgi:hypothetical protein